jgi:predicted MPP superfamily phosphohydrolase
MFMKLLAILRKSAWIIIRSILSTIIIVGIIFFYAYRVEPNWIKVKEQPVSLSGLPAAFDGYRIVQLSDLHGKLFPVKELVNRVRELNPDLVVITGDVLDEENQVPVEYINTALGGLVAKDGVYFVFGNNDYYPGKQVVQNNLEGIGIKTIQNDTVLIRRKGQTLNLVGVNDPETFRARLTQALKGSVPGPQILLAHGPTVVNEAAKAGIELVLVGHTHGGQINLPGIPKVLPHVKRGFKKYVSGLFTVNNTQMYVNQGLGVSDIPLRIMDRPEITVTTLKK